MRYPKLCQWSVCVLFCGISTLWVGLIAQPVISDGMHRELLELTNDSLRLQYCLKMARSATIAEATQYLGEGEIIAQRLGDHKSMAELYTEVAILENRQGNHMRGVHAFMKVDSLSRLLGDTNKLAAVQTNLGLSHFYGGNQDKALQHYYQAYQLYETISDPRGLSRLLNNLAICSKELGKLTEAEKYYRESFALKQTLADSNGMATSLMNLGLLLGETKRYEEALDTLQEAQKRYQALQAIEDASACQLAMGKIMIDHGQWDRALPYVYDSYQYFHKYASQSPYLLLAAGDLAKIRILRKEWYAAKSYVVEALALARQSDKLENLRDLLKNKATVDYALGNFQSSHLALEEAYLLNDSLKEHSKLSLIEEMQARFGVDAKEKEIMLLNTQRDLDQIRLRTTKNRNLILLLVGLALAFFSIFLYRLYRQINQQKEVIAINLAEKETLLKEIHHRVKNNLQIISSLLNLQSYQIKDDSAMEAIRQSRNRVKSMSLIHQSLYQDKDLLAVEMSAYIDTLSRSLFDSYNIDEERISLKTKIDPIQLDVDIMIPLGLILNELISNALKYAFADGRRGELNIRLAQDQNQLALEVSDNGVGLPSDFKLEQTLSLGYLLIQDFCKKLKAVLKIGDGEGTTVMILIPNVS